MGPVSVAVVIGIIVVALGFVARSRPTNKGMTGPSLAGTWEGINVEVHPKCLPVVGYLRLTLSPHGTYQNEVTAFLGSMPLGRPETVMGTFTYEPDAGGESGVLAVRVCRPRTASGTGTVVWLGKDQFTYTGVGATVRYTRVS